jgi:transcriptional regulator with XRE-family HTH domain
LSVIEPVGRRLRSLRLERYLTQHELADLAGLHELTLQRIESGKAAPFGKTVRRLAAALGVRPDQLAKPEETAEARRSTM